MTVVPQIRTPSLAALERRVSRALDEGVSERAMRLIAGDLVRSTRKRIASEKTSPDGTPWYAWSDDYERRKRPGSMLYQSRALHRSVQAIVGRDEIEWGSNDIKAAVHQFGYTVRSGPFAGRHIPARPYLGLSSADERMVTDRIIDDVRRRFAS